MHDVRPRGGRRIVLGMYVVSVVTAGVFGYVLGVIVYGNGGMKGPLPEGGPKPLYGEIGPLVFQLNGPNLALFGIVSVGLLLGVGLLAITQVGDATEINQTRTG